MSKTSKFKRLKAVIGAIVLTGVMMTSTIASTVNAAWKDFGSPSGNLQSNATYIVSSADISAGPSELARKTLSGWDDPDSVKYSDTATSCTGSYIDRDVFEAGDVVVSIGFDYKIDTIHKIITVQNIYGVVTDTRNNGRSQKGPNDAYVLCIPRTVTTGAIDKVIGDFFDTNQFGKKEFVTKNEIVDTTLGYQTHVTSSAQSVLRGDSLTIKKVIMDDGMKTSMNEAKYNTIYLPSSVTDFRAYKSASDSASKSHLKYISAVVVDNDHPVYSSDEGVLFNKAGTELLWMPPQIHAKAYTSYLLRGADGRDQYGKHWCLTSKANISNSKNAFNLTIVDCERINENAFVDFNAKTNTATVPSLDSRKVKTLRYAAPECATVDSIDIHGTPLNELENALKKAVNAPEYLGYHSSKKDEYPTESAKFSTLNGYLEGIVEFHKIDAYSIVIDGIEFKTLKGLPITKAMCENMERYRVSKTDLVSALSSATGVRSDLLKVQSYKVDRFDLFSNGIASSADVIRYLRFIPDQLMNQLSAADHTSGPLTIYIPKTIEYIETYPISKHPSISKLDGFTYMHIPCRVENHSKNIVVKSSESSKTISVSNSKPNSKIFMVDMYDRPAVTTPAVTTTTKTTTTKTTTTTVTSNKNPAVTDPEGYVKTRYDIDLTDYADGLEITHNGFIYKPSEFNYEKLEKDGKVTYNVIWCWVDCVGTTLNNTNISEVHLSGPFDVEDEAYKKKLSEAIKKAIGNNLDSKLTAKIDEEMESKLRLSVMNASYACLRDFLNACGNIRIYAYDTAVKAITPLPKAEIIDPLDMNVRRMHYSAAPSKASDGLVGRPGTNICVFDCVTQYGYNLNTVLCSETTGNATDFIFSDKVKGATVTNLSNILKVADSLTFYNKDTVLSSADFLKNDVTWDDKSFGLSEIPEHKDTLVIRGYSGSTAEKFAKEIGADFEVIDSNKTREAKHFLSKTTTGDLNNDNDGGGIADIAMLSKYLVSDIAYPLSMQGLINADVNNDNGVDSLDTNYMIEAALGNAQLPE